jgi:hypothetical protein
MRRGYARSEERNAAVRAQLAPLAPGERPPALVAAAIVAALLGAANLVALIAGLDVQGEEPNAIGVLAFCAVMFVAAAGPGLRGAARDHRRLLLAVPAARLQPARRRGLRADHLRRRLAVLEAHPRDGQAPGSPARSLDSGALWLTPSTTASSSARVRADTSPRSAPPSSA